MSEMHQLPEPGPFTRLYDDLKAGALSRRAFTARALALGVGMPVISFVLRAVPEAGAAPRSRHAGFGVAAQQGAAGRPAVGVEGKKRGQDGELKILQWQSPTILSPHVATGTKDYLASSIVLEPMMSYLPDGSLIPTLIKDVPTIENGLLAKDLKSVTYKLLDGVKWSDGEPFTAKDVVFTWKWIMDEANASVSIETYRPIANIEAVDDVTAKVTFNNPNANWFEPHAGSVWGNVYPEHVLSAGKEAADAFVQKPIGTGAYVVESFKPGDQVVYAMNENYRDPDKPYFSKVNLKGGGDAASAARAVLQTGDYDHAWNLQVEPQILKGLEEGGKGKLIVAVGNSVERLHVNFSDPNKEVDGQRSEKNTPHPFFSDIAVRQALNLAANRDAISTQFYQGKDEPPTANILTNTPLLGKYSTEDKDTSWEFDVDKGNKILDDAGWTKNGDVRSKDGVELRMTYATSINAVRQKTQAVIKQALEKMGFKVQLQQVDSGIFFDGSAGNEQSINHMYNDINMFTNNPTTPFPTAYMTSWYAGPDGKNIAQASNRWNGQNYQRYNSPDFDKLFTAVQTETDLEKAAQLFVQMNDILIKDIVIVPLVNRAADKYAMAKSLIHGDGPNDDNVALSPYEVNYWNIANWNRASQ